jgi:hypothetical protein
MYQANYQANTYTLSQLQGYLLDLQERIRNLEAETTALDPLDKEQKNNSQQIHAKIKELQEEEEQIQAEIDTRTQVNMPEQLEVSHEDLPENEVSPNTQNFSLSPEIWLLVLSYLKPADLTRLGLVNKEMHAYASDNQLWQPFVEPAQQEKHEEISYRAKFFQSYDRYRFSSLEQAELAKQLLYAVQIGDTDTLTKILDSHPTILQEQEVTIGNSERSKTLYDVLLSLALRHQHDAITRKLLLTTLDKEKANKVSDARGFLISYLDVLLGANNDETISLKESGGEEIASVDESKPAIVSRIWRTHFGIGEATPSEIPLGQGFNQDVVLWLLHSNIIPIDKFDNKIMLLFKRALELQAFTWAKTVFMKTHVGWRLALIDKVKAFGNLEFTKSIFETMDPDYFLGERYDWIMNNHCSEALLLWLIQRSPIDTIPGSWKPALRENLISKVISQALKLKSSALWLYLLENKYIPLSPEHLVEAICMHDQKVNDNQFEIIKILIEQHNIDPNAKVTRGKITGTAAFFALRRQNVQLLRYLVEEKQANLSESDFRVAMQIKNCHSEQFSLVQYVYEHTQSEIDLTKWSEEILRRAYLEGNLHTIKWVIVDKRISGAFLLDYAQQKKSNQHNFLGFEFGTQPISNPELQKKQKTIITILLNQVLLERLKTMAIKWGENKNTQSTEKIIILNKLHDKLLLDIEKPLFTTINEMMATAEGCEQLKTLNDNSASKKTKSSGFFDRFINFSDGISSEMQIIIDGLTKDNSPEAKETLKNLKVVLATDNFVEKLKLPSPGQSSPSG